METVKIKGKEYPLKMDMAALRWLEIDNNLSMQEILQAINKAKFSIATMLVYAMIGRERSGITMDELLPHVVAGGKRDDGIILPALKAYNKFYESPLPEKNASRETKAKK